MSEASAATPRKRGRPRKEGGTTPKPVVLDSTGQPRKRGRPRKYPPGESPKPTKSSTPGRGRGRPKKSGSEARVPVNGTAKKPKGSDGGAGVNFDMDSICGTYSLQCEEVEENWPEMAGDMEMKVVEQAHGFAASFDLGIITGVMLFAPDKKSLDKFVAIKSEGENGGREGSSGDEDADGESDSEQEQQKAAKKARKITSYNSTPTILKSRRVLLKWRGREESTGEIHTSSSDGNEGYLEFEDDDATKFVGFSWFPAMGSNCKFTGTKVGGSYGPITAIWRDFSQKAADQANVNRWK